MSKRHFWKINPDLKSGLDFGSKIQPCIPEIVENWFFVEPLRPLSVQKLTKAK